MKKLRVLVILILCVACLSFCGGMSNEKANTSGGLVEENVFFSAKQYSLMIPMPEDFGKMKFIPPQGWISGFSPGSLWCPYELTGDGKWKEPAMKQAVSHADNTIKIITGPISARGTSLNSSKADSSIRHVNTEFPAGISMLLGLPCRER